MICASGGSKRRLAKAAGAEPSGQMRDGKVDAVVARSTFRSQNVQNTPGPDHFWKLRCRKSARPCGAKHISKSKLQSTPGSDHFWKLRCRKSARRCGAKHISKSNIQNTPRTDHFWTFRARFAWQAQGIVHLVKSEQNVRVLCHFQKRWQAWAI